MAYMRPFIPVTSLNKFTLTPLLISASAPACWCSPPPMRLLHINQYASELIQDITHVKHGNGRSKREMGFLPMSVYQICTEIFATLRDRTHAKDWERFEIKRVICAPHQPILIRGFGVPDSGKREHSRVVLLLEPVGRRKEESMEETRARFQFTVREQAVVQCLAKGWTNKEIGDALELALPTVKEHIRHIMVKTNTTTRTGVLVRVFHK